MRSPSPAAAVWRTAAMTCARKRRIYFDEHHVAHIDKDKVRGVRHVLQGLPVFSAIVEPQASLRERLQGQGHFTMNEDTIRRDPQRTSASPAARASISAPSARSWTNRSYWTRSSCSRKRPKPDNKVYAVVAPSIASQFTYAKLGQVITGLKKLGFHTVVEAALGADMVAQAEIEGTGREGLFDQLLLPGVRDLHPQDLPQAGRQHLAQSLAHGDDFPLYQGNDARREDRLYWPVHGQKDGNSAGQRARMGGCGADVRGASGAL